MSALDSQPQIADRQTPCSGFRHVTRGRDHCQIQSPDGEELTSPSTHPVHLSRKPLLLFWGGSQEQMYRRRDLLEAPGERKEAIWEVLTLLPTVPASQVAQWQRIRLPVQELQETWFSPWVRKIPWRRKWQPTPVFLPGQFHGQRSLVGYCPWDHKESDRTKATQYITCMWNLHMTKHMKQKETHRHRKQTCGCQGGGMDWEFGISKYKLLHIEWINNKVLFLAQRTISNIL